MTRDQKPKTDKQSNRAEPWEVEFIHHEFPTHQIDDVERAADECKEEVKPATDREKVLKCVRRKFS